MWRLNEPEQETKENHSFASDGLKWWEQSELKRLYLSSNKLEILPDGLGNLITLEILEVCSRILVLWASGDLMNR